MTAAQIQAEIDELTTAISQIRIAGQSYTINSGSSTRTVTMADYDKLVRDRRDLQLQLDELNGTAGMTLTAGW